MKYYFKTTVQLDKTLYNERFIKDVEFHGKRGDLLSVSGNVDDHVEIRLASGEQLISGRNYWGHENGDMNVLSTTGPDAFSDMGELFCV